MDMRFDFTSELTGETEALDIPFGVGFFTLPSDYSCPNAYPNLGNG